MTFQEITFVLHYVGRGTKDYIFQFRVFRVLNFILIFPLKLHCAHCVFRRHWHLTVYCHVYDLVADHVDSEVRLMC